MGWKQPNGNWYFFQRAKAKNHVQLTNFTEVNPWYVEVAPAHVISKGFNVLDRNGKITAKTWKALREDAKIAKVLDGMHKN